MSSLWGFEWGEEWGSSTSWGARVDDANPETELLEILPGDLEAVETATDRIPRQFELAESWVQMQTAIGAAFGDVDVVLGQLEPQRYAGSATGVWLDRCAEIVGLPRSGWSSDADYRLALIAEALSQVTAGIPDEIIDVAIRLAPEGSAVRYREIYPAAFLLTVPDLEPGRLTLIAAVMADMPPSGVGAFLETYDSTAVAGWSWDVAPSATFGAFAWDGAGAASTLALWSWDATIG